MALLSILVPGAYSNNAGSIAEYDPVLPVTIEVARPSVVTEAVAVSAPVEAADAAHTTPAPPDNAEERSPSATESLPPGTVRELHVMYARPGDGAEADGAGVCPRSSSCERHQLRSSRWPLDDTGRLVIPFAYNDEGRRPVRAEDGILGPALRAATGEWSRWNSNIVFENDGTTTATFGADGPDGTCDDGTNVVTWKKFDPSVIGAAVLCMDDSGKVIRDADLALNSTQHWEPISGEPDSRHSYDIQSILTHELGHWLALEDIYSPDSAAQTMHGSTKYGETRKRTLALGDVVGLQKAYPCGPEDTCPREGIADD